MDQVVRWVITLSASKADAERLVQSMEDLAVHPTEPNDMVLEVHVEGDEPSPEMTQAVQAIVDARVRHINGFGKLRWGRNFEGVTVKGTRSFAPDGAETQHIVLGSAVAHLLPKDFADMMERLGHPRPALPEGLETIEALDPEAVTELAESHPIVGRVLRLVELMLEGDEQIDWGAAYSALETVEHDLHAHGVDGRAEGWWTKREREDFKATANSAEALGVYARHGKPGGVSVPRMDHVEASWYVRRVVAHWLTYLLQAQD